MIGNRNGGNPGHPTQDASASQTGVPRIFVSYSRKDSLFTRRLYDALAARGIDAWVDWEGIPPSAEWWREVERAIEGAETFVFVITPESMDSAVCQNEIAHALRHNKRLIPLVFRDPAQPAQPATDLTAAIGRINWIYFRETGDFEQGLARLIEAIKTDLDWVRSHSRLPKRLVAAIAPDRGARVTFRSP